MTTEFNEKLRRIKIDFLYTGCVKFLYDNISKFN